MPNNLSLWKRIRGRPRFVLATLRPGARRRARFRSTGGWCLDVTEAEIAIAKAEIGAEGLGCEPASAVTLAGLKKLRAGQDCRERDGGAGADRAHAEGCRLHDRFPSRHAAERGRERGQEAEIAGLQRNAHVVDATPAAVLAALKDSVG